MSERQINDPQLTPQAPVPVDASAQQLASARRRRFIKMGAGVVPVAMTLTSRPVLATVQGKCFSASAWGSVQNLVGTNASTYTRKRDSAPTVTCYTKTEWCGTSSGKPNCSGWTNIGCTTTSSVKAYTVQTACGSSTGTANVAAARKIWDCLNDLDVGLSPNYYPKCTDDQKVMLVAWLNCRATSTSTEVCVVDTYKVNQLTNLGNIMKNGSGTGPDGKTWDKPKVVDYLQELHRAHELNRLRRQMAGLRHRSRR